MLTHKDILIKLRKSYGWDWQNLEELALAIGYVFDRKNSSHKIFKHPGDINNLVIPCNTDLRRTDCSIIKQLRTVYFNIHPTLVPIVNIPEESMAKTPKGAWFDFVRNTRHNAGLKQREVAKALDIPDNTFSRIELGFRHFYEDEFYRWAKFFKLENPSEYIEYIELNQNLNKRSAKEKSEEMIPREAKTISVSNPVKVLNPEEIIESIKMKLERLEELQIILKDIDKLQEEYETLLEELSRAGTL